MNVASLELCKELYELSGWDDTEHWHVRTGLNFVNVPLAATVYFLKDHPEYDREAPAYDLGYLLRKLPDFISTRVLYMDGKRQYEFNCEDMEFQINGEVFGAEWPDDFDETTFLADTPEDAACQLAIQLFKTGILKKEV